MQHQAFLEHNDAEFFRAFLGDDITHAPRKWVTSPDFPGLINELPEGAPMNHSLFPVIWEC